MLSGFVLSYTNSGKVFIEPNEYKSFYIKRFIRTIPIYWVVALLYTVISPIICNENIKDILLLFPIETLGLQTVFCSIANYSHNNGTWFISCLLFCYFVFPFLHTITRAIRRRTRLVISVAIIVILLYSPIVVWQMNDVHSIYSNPFFRVLEFILGCFVFEEWKENRKDKTKNRILLFVSFVSLLLIVFFKIPNYDYLLYNWVMIPVSIIMFPLLADVNMTKLQDSKLLKYLVDISYVFFLSQVFTWPICRLLFKHFGGIDSFGLTTKLVLSLSVCFFLSIVFHELIEKPLTKFLNNKLLMSL